MTEIKAIDLFCGVGGLTHGLEKSGINVVAGVDIDPQSQYAYERNNSAKFIMKSVDDLTKADLNPLFGDSKLTLLAGCAPCQPFSRYSLAAANRMHAKWSLLHEFGRLILEAKPTFVTMENVPDLVRDPIYAQFLDLLKSRKYKIWTEVVECQEFGVPQARKRLVLLGSKLGKIELLKISRKPKTVKDAIGALPRLNAGDADRRDPLHTSAALDEVNLSRIRQSRPGGTWRDWDSQLVAACHQKGSGKSYPSVYGRMEWDKPAPTMTTQFYGYGNGRFGHPEQDRAISLREGAIFQSFPRNYHFVEAGQPISRRTVGRLIGNAVPPALGHAIGKSIIRHVENAS